MKALETISYTATKTVQVVEPTSIKALAAVLLSLGFFLFGNLHWQALTAIVMLMIFDTILGVIAAVHEGDAISSSKMARVLLKGTVYLTAISAAYYADATIPLDFIQATMIAFVGVTEFISILENIGRLGYATPNKLLNNLKDYRDSK